ncbi:MAG TPA: serpin family protein [Aggregatilineaceae bacterium]|nr:serpin family protein [Aggregatilineaceae bacterium]
MKSKLVRSFVVLALLLGIAVTAQAQDSDPAAQVAADNNAFAFDLYQAIRSQDGNLILSPYSISQALALVYAGAKGTTEQQMAETLHFTLPQNELHSAFAALDASVRPADDSFRLNIANALWGQQGFAFLPDFLTLLENNYGAGLQEVDYNDPEAAREMINQWVSDQTEDLIPDLITEGVLTPETKLVLTNAIYFKAAWDAEFDPNFTSDAPFMLLDGSSVNVPMMGQTGGYSYTSGEGYQAVLLPYDGEQAAMLMIVPDSGQFEAVESALAAEMYTSVLDALQPMTVSLRMPLFEYRADFELAEPLAALGMADAFSGDADFSGMTGQRDLSIDAIVHQAYIKTTEEGTEAAAATAIEMGATAIMPDIDLNIDRPFLYFLIDQPTRTILFMGRVLNPAES